MGASADHIRELRRWGAPPASRNARAAQCQRKNVVGFAFYLKPAGVRDVVAKKPIFWQSLRPRRACVSSSCRSKALRRQIEGEDEDEDTVLEARVV